MQREVLKPENLGVHELRTILVLLLDKMGLEVTGTWDDVSTFHDWKDLKLEPIVKVN